LGIGTNGQILTSTGTAPQWSTLSGVAVTTFSAGTTGFTPSTATSGAVTLAGTLATTNGGTGLTSFTANGVVYASSSSALTTGSALTFDGSSLYGFSGAATQFLRLGNNTTDVYFTGTSGVANINVGQFGGQLAFSLVSAEQMRLTSTGLGIGTSSPWTKLSVYGSGDQRIAVTSPTGGSTIAAIDLSPSLTAGEAAANAPQARIYAVDSNYSANIIFASKVTGATANALQTRMTLDSSGNLGLGVTPSAWISSYRALNIGDSGLVTSRTGASINNIEIGVNWFRDSGAAFRYKANGFVTNYQQFDGAHYWYNAASGTAGNTISFTQAMTLDASGNLGIGTSSPGARLDAVITDGTAYNSATAGVYVARVRNLFASAGNTQALISHNCDNYSSVWNSGLVETSGGSFTGAYVWQNRTGSTTYAERMRLDSSGNLGLGVTPSAWGQGRAFEISAVGEGLWGNGLGDIWMINGAYFNSGWKYSGTTRATAYRQGAGTTDGSHAWYTAPSGTAGNAITFTQAMTLDASGVLLVGATSALGVTGEKVTISNNNNTVLSIVATNDTTPSIQFNSNSVDRLTIDSSSNYGAYFNVRSNQDIRLGTNNTERARITSGGDLLVGKTSSDLGTAGIEIFGAGYGQFTANNDASLFTNRLGSDGDTVKFYRATSLVGSISVTTSATAYNTSSDYRLKDNPQPLTGSGAFIDALKPKTWNWKTDGSKGVGFIAHEVQEVSPASVTGEKDGEQMQAMEYGSAEFIANIIAELQSLRARVAQLEAK
jgi:hypothetical protein